MKIKLLAMFAIVAVGLSSCATIFTGTKDTITFNSKPEGATVYLDGVELCKTPCTTPVKRSLNEKSVEIKLDGYKTRVITLDRSFNVISILNIGGLVGWAVDAATGSIFKYDRKQYDIDLELDKALSMYDVKDVEIDTVNQTLTLKVAKK